MSVTGEERSEYAAGVNERGYSWAVRVRPKGGGAIALVRTHEVRVGTPLSFDAQYEGVTALEQFLAAFGSEVLLGLLAAAKRARVPVDEAEVLVRCELNNPLVHLGVVGEPGHPGIEAIEARVFVASPAEERTVGAAWDDARRRLPLYTTLSAAVPRVEVAVVVTA